jgi:hypothetical protein
MTRDEARAWYAQMLMDKIRTDRYPSSNHMDMVEAVLPQLPQLTPDYMDVLLEKVADDQFPSTDMLKRIAAVAETLPNR